MDHSSPQSRRATLPARSEAGSLLADSLQRLLASFHPRPSPTLQPRGDPRSLGLQCGRKRDHGPGKPPERNLQSYSEDRALQPRKPFMAACPQNNRHTRFFPIHLTVTPSGTRTPTLLSRIPHSRLGVARAEDATADRHTDPSEPRFYLARPHPAPRSPPQELQDRAEKRGLTPRETSAAALTPPSPAKRESSIPPPEKTCWDQKPKT